MRTILRFERELVEQKLRGEQANIEKMGIKYLLEEKALSKYKHLK